MRKMNESEPSMGTPEQASSSCEVDGRLGRTESHEIRVWWEVVIEGRVWNTRNETEAREMAQRASEIGTEHELRRVEAVSRTETVTKVEVLSPIAAISDSPTETSTE
jgi:hypothetical protein